MPLPNDEIPDDSHLIRFLVGALPEDEAEPLAKASVTDDEFAARLSALENDLVDAYVRGELEGETLARFKTWYLASKPRRQKVAFAATLLARERNEHAEASARGATEGTKPLVRSDAWPGRGGAWRLLAAASLLVVTAAAWIVLYPRESGLVDEIATGEIREAPEVSAPPADPPPSVAETPPTTPAPSTDTAPLTAISFLLAPQTRAATPVERVRVPRGVEQVTARLRLEFDDYPRYEAVLKDPAADEILWRSGALRARTEGEHRTVPVSLPAALLKSQNYSLELFGSPADGASEFIGNYVFRAVLE